MSALDDLVDLPGSVGDIARDYASRPALPMEMPQDREARLSAEDNFAAKQAQTQQKQQNLLTAGDFARKGVPSYLDQGTGSVQPVTDETGAKMTGFDKANGIAYDSRGFAKTVSYDPDSGLPKLGDPFAGIPTMTDKTGNQYQIRKGLPWNWVGTDQDVVDANAQKEAEKQAKLESQSLGKPIALARYQEIQGNADIKHTGKALQNYITDPATGTLPDSRDDAQALIDARFDTSKSEAANKKSGWFGSGDLTPEAQQLQAQNAADKARIEALADKHYAAREKLDSIKQQHESMLARQAALAAGVKPEQLHDSIMQPQATSQNILQDGSTVEQQPATSRQDAGSTPEPASAEQIEQIQAVQKDHAEQLGIKPSVWDRAKNFAGSIVSGAASGTAEAIEGAHRMMDALGIPKTWNGNPTTENDVSTAISNALQKVPGVVTDPRWKDNGEAVVGRFVGGIAPLVAEGAIAPELLIPTLASQGYNSQYQSAKQYFDAKSAQNPDAPRDIEHEEHVANRSGVIGAGINAILGIPFEGAGEAIASVFGNATTKAVQSALTKAYEQGGVGAVSEMLYTVRQALQKVAVPSEQQAAKDGAIKGMEQVVAEIQKPATERIATVAARAAKDAGIFGGVQVGQNAVTKSYNPDTGLFENVPTAMFQGALIGGGFGAIGEGAKAKQAAAAREQLEAEFSRRAKPVSGRDVTGEQPPPETGEPTPPQPVGPTGGAPTEKPVKGREVTPTQEPPAQPESAAPAPGETDRKEKASSAPAEDDGTPAATQAQSVEQNAPRETSDVPRPELVKSPIKSAFPDFHSQTDENIQHAQTLTPDDIKTAKAEMKKLGDLAKQPGRSMDELMLIAVRHQQLREMVDAVPEQVSPATGQPAANTEPTPQVGPVGEPVTGKSPEQAREADEKQNEGKRPAQSAVDKHVDKLDRLGKRPPQGLAEKLLDEAALNPVSRDEQAQRDLEEAQSELDKNPGGSPVAHGEHAKPGYTAVEPKQAEATNAPPEPVTQKHIGKEVETPDGIRGKLVAYAPDTKNAAVQVKGDVRPRVVAKDGLRLVTKEQKPAKPETQSDKPRIRLGSSPQAYTVEERLAPQKGDQPGEEYYRVRNEHTGEMQTVEKKDMIPVGEKGAWEKQAAETVAAKKEASTLALANAAMKAHAAELKALGHPVELARHTAREGEAGLVTTSKNGEARISIDPDALTKDLETLSPKARLEKIKRAIAEEVIHVGTLKYADESPENKAKLMGLLDDAELMKRTGEAYGATWDKQSDFAKAAEAARVLIQGPEELTEASHRFLSDFLKWLKSKLRNLTKETRELIAGIEAKLGRAKKEEVKEAPKPAAEQAPLKASDRSVRDHPIRGARDGDEITISMKYGPKLKFSASELADMTEWDRKQLLDTRTANWDDEAGGAGQAARLRDGIRNIFKTLVPSKASFQDRIDANRKAKETAEASAIKEAASPTKEPSPPSKHQSKAASILPDDLFAAPIEKPVGGYKQPLPRDKAAKFQQAAYELLDAGIDTPEKLAAALEEKYQGRARAYSNALWKTMENVGAPEASPDWGAVYSNREQYAKPHGEAPVRPTENLALKQETAKAEAPKRTFKRSIPPAPGGGSDLIDELLGDVGKIQSPFAAYRAQQKREGKTPFQKTSLGGEWEGWKDLPKDLQAVIFSRNGSLSPDGAASQFKGRDFTPASLREELLKAWKTRKSAVRGEKIQNKEARDGERLVAKQDAAFEKVATVKGANDEAISSDELKTGDVLDVDGQKLKVIHVDEDGIVTLEDHARFGVQTIEAGQIIYGELESAPEEDDGWPSLEKEVDPVADSLTLDTDAKAEAYAERHDLIEADTAAKPAEESVAPKALEKPAHHEGEDRAGKIESGGEVGALFNEGEMPFNLAGESQQAVKPVEETTAFGNETLAQQEMFAIQKVVESKDPAKSADAVEKQYGGAREAAARLVAQLRVIDSDPSTKKGFVKEQRGRLNEVIKLLQQRAEKAVTLSAEERATETAQSEQSNQSRVDNVASRFRPKERIEFPKPFFGPSGAKLTAYEWQWQPEEYVDKRGEDRVRRVSDWEKAESSAETGRDIVHQFSVTMPDGDERIVSAESVPQLLGFTEYTQPTRLGSIVSATKTLAKQKMKLALTEAQISENERIHEEVKKLSVPEISGPSKAFPNSPTSDAWRFDIPESSAMQIQHEQGHATQYTKDSLAFQWRDAQEKSRGSQRIGVSVRELKRAIEKQERKIKLLSEAQAEPSLAVEASSKSEAEKPTSIQDFGEKLGGARKDLAASMTRDFSDDDIARLPLSEIWPKSDVDAIEDIPLAALATAVRAEIPSKPRQSYKVRRWAEQVKQVRGLMRVAGEQGFDAVIKKMGEHRLVQLVNKIALLQSVPREHWGRVGRVEDHPDAYQYKRGADGQPEYVNGKMVQIPSPFAEAEVDGRRISAPQMNELIDKVGAKLTGEVPTDKMKFEVRGGGDHWFINKKGDPLYRKLQNFSDSKAAVAFARNPENYTLLVSAWDDVKQSDNVKETDVRREVNRDRSGKDWRNGRDGTPEMFTDSFGFRGAEFGNWVSQGKNIKERQGMLNAAFDALHDLADTVGIPPKAISLNGTLGLGFGSRGHGWASAHYEPDNLVINLTKTRGAGSLAHEWFHALDNYFQRKRNERGIVGRHGDYITEQPETYYEAKDGTRLSAARFEDLRSRNRITNPESWSKIEGVRPQVAEAFADLVKALNESPMAKRAALIDKGKSDGYWSRVIERAARSFENYVIAKMQVSGTSNDYLANVQSVDDFARDKERYPYLLQIEIEPVSQAFDNLFGSIQTRATEKGVELHASPSLRQTQLERITSRRPLTTEEQNEYDRIAGNTGIHAAGKVIHGSHEESGRETGQGRKERKINIGGAGSPDRRVQKLNRIGTVSDTRESIQQHLATHKGLLADLQCRAEEVAAEESGNGLAFIPSENKIVFNAEKFHALVTLPSVSDEMGMIESGVKQEIIHAADFDLAGMYVANENQKAFDKAVRRTRSLASLAYPELPESQIGTEYIRMLVEHRAGLPLSESFYSDTTELEGQLSKPQPQEAEDIAKAIIKRLGWTYHEPTELHAAPTEHHAENQERNDRGRFVENIRDKFTPGLDVIGSAKRGIQSLLLPSAQSAGHLKAAEVLGSKLGPMNQRQESARYALRNDWKTFERLGVHRKGDPSANPGIRFMSAMSTGIKLPPNLAPIAQRIQSLFDQRIEALKESGAPLQTVRENYFPGMWTRESRMAFNMAMEQAVKEGVIGEGFDVNNATPEQKAFVKERVDKALERGQGSDKDMLSYVTRRPMKGKESFRKQKVFEDILDAAEFGLRPISRNPVDLVMGKLAEMDRNIMANEAFQHWKAQGQLKVSRPSDKIPDGWQKINDKYGTIYGPREIEVRAKNSRLLDEDGREISLEEAGLDALPPEGTKLKVRVPGLLVTGYRIVPNEVGDIANNYLSSSLYNNRYFGTLYKGWMGMANALNQAQLGVGSAFHAGFTTAEAQISAGANLIKDVFGVLRGNRTMGQLGRTARDFTVATGETYRTGDKVLNAWRNPDGVIDPKIRQVVRAAELAGGGFKLETGLQTEQSAKMQSDWLNDHKIRAAMRSPVALVEMMAHPIMNGLVPRQKAGVFAHLAWRIIEQNQGKTLEELTPEFRQAWNRVDARLGQVRYNRLFINNEAKNVVQGLVRAPGWSGGTIAELGGAFKDTCNFFAEFARTGKLPQDMPDRVAYTVSLLLTVGLTNALLTYLFTGEEPKDLDYWAFRTGGKDEKGQPERFVLPTYMKDVLAYAKAPLRTLMDKSHPLLSLFGDLIHNKDYYGVQIRDEDANALTQAAQSGKYFAKAFTPFWMRGTAKEIERKATPVRLAAPLVGIMPAPRKMTESPAMALAHSINAAAMPAAPISQQQAEKRMEKSKLSMELRMGDFSHVSREIATGHIRPQDVPQMIKRSQMPPIVAATHSMSLEQVERVFAKANEEEKRQLAPVISQKKARSRAPMLQRF